MIRRVLLVLALLGASSHAADAQMAPDTAARRAAMDRFAYLVGEWSGDAWAMVGAGQRVEMRQTEIVRRSLGGQVLLIEGIGRRLVNGEPADTTFHAVATMDWEPERGYRMRAYTLVGHAGDFEVRPVEGGFDWTAPAPGGSVLYRMRLTPDGRWDERGEYQRGDQAYPVVALDLRKIR